MKPYDFVEPYMRAIFGFVGITDIDFFRAQPMDVSPDIRRMAQRAAIHEVREYAESGRWRVPGPVATAELIEVVG